MDTTKIKRIAVKELWCRVKSVGYNPETIGGETLDKIADDFFGRVLGNGNSLHDWYMSASDAEWKSFRLIYRKEQGRSNG